jgi:hypothetical protein
LLVVEWLVAIVLLSGCTLDRSGAARISSDDAGTECREACPCATGETRTVPCGMCGTQTERCEDGVFVPSGACTGEGECVPGTVTELGACARCGTVRQTCGADCRLPAAVCEGSGECEAGVTETESRACGACSTEMRTRTCNAGCGWDAFGAWSACSEECVPGTTMTITMPCGACGRGTQAAVRTCNASCTYDPPTPSGSCTGDRACTVGSKSICPGSGAWTREGCERGGAHWCQCTEIFGIVCTGCG